MKVSGSYLTFNGNCREAMTFYSKVFGSEISSSMSWADAERHAGKDMKFVATEEDKDRIMHSSMMIGDTFALMACDAHPMMHKNGVQIGNNYQICLEPDSKDAAHRFYSALEDGSSEAMPLQDMWWGSYHGSLTDKFGIRWMFDMANPSTKEEIVQCGLKAAVDALRASAKVSNSVVHKLEALIEQPPAKKANVGND